MNNRLAKAQQLGFDNLKFGTQWIIFNKAYACGWNGEAPVVLGSDQANTALDAALDYLLTRLDLMLAER